MIIDNVTPSGFINEAARRLMALRQAFEQVQEFQNYLAGIAVTDLEATSTASPPGLGLSASYAQGVKTAFADADALRQLYQTGSLPGAYTLPYVFESSQAPIIGAQ